MATGRLSRALRAAVPWSGATGWYLVALAGFGVLPLVTGQFTANKIAVFALFALGFNLLLGYTGELSFGHAVFFGLGAYGTIFGIQYVAQNLLVGMVLGTALATAVSVVVSVVSFRQRGIYFSMITLALGQLIFYLLYQGGELTGGPNGLSTPPSFTATIGPIDLSAGGLTFYVFALAVLGCSWLCIRRIVRSPFGKTIVAIRENEERMTHLGYRTTRYLQLTFVMSSVFSGIAGALYITLFQFVSPELLTWTTSGEVVGMALLGGINTLSGPIVGAGVFVFLSDQLTQLTENWRMVLGAFIVLIVLFAPAGLYGMVRNADRGFDVRALVDSLRP